jgi:hypothetical protein
MVITQILQLTVSITIRQPIVLILHQLKLPLLRLNLQLLVTLKTYTIQMV